MANNNMLRFRATSVKGSFDGYYLRREKRRWTLANRGLDFTDATKVFDTVEMELEDDRHDYGEVRHITYGQIGDRPVAVVWTRRGTNRRIISMRHVHEREIEARRRALD